jgi:AraC-like DNA-binding protein
MSKSRHATIFDTRAQASYPVTTLEYDYPPGYIVPRHFHETDQLVYAISGVMTVLTSEGTWVVPTQRAVWIPAKMPHSIRMSGAVSMRTLYFRRRYMDVLPRRCRVVNVTPLLRELVLHCCQFPGLTRRDPKQAHLIDTLSDQLQVASVVPLQLPNPSEPRAAAVATALSKDPGDARAIDEVCRAAGAGRRTIERTFRRETGMTLGRWRQQLRLLHATQLMAQGSQITRAALDAGYSTPSAFIFAFRKTLGTTPGRYFGR